MADFLEKVRQSIDKGLTTASIRSKEMFEAAKLKREAAALQKRRRGLLEKLGDIVYTMFLNRSGFDEEKIKEMGEAIARLDSRIKEKEGELEQIHLKAQEALRMSKTDVVLCDCGAKVNKNAKFCSKCGEEVVRF